MRRFRQRRSSGFMLPFLILVGVGIIAALGFQLWGSFQGAKGKALFYLIPSGEADILTDGSDWTDAYSGTELLAGDSLKTSNSGKVVIKFENGTLARLGESSQITVMDISNEDIRLTLDKGKIWFNKPENEDKKVNVEVNTSHMRIKDIGTIFEVEASPIESVRVIKGRVNVEILANGQNKNQVTTQEEVQVGQEIDLDSAMLKKLQNHEEVTLKLAIRQEFKDSEWYQWNMKEDKNPTDFSKNGATSADSITDTTDGSTSGSSDDSTTATDSPDTIPTVDAKIKAPTITQPASAEVTTDQNKQTISGTVDSKTAKIVVKQVIQNLNSEYTLTKFKAGDTTFTYNVSETLGNLKPGLNTYNFYAYDASGNQSDVAQVKISYNKPAPVITDALTAPKVLSFNGGSSSTVTTGSVKVEGEIHGAAKVVVNGYTLGKFEPGATRWAYYATESTGNLKPGTNEYQVYGVDTSGKKSEVVKFTITYNKPATQPSPAPTPPAAQPSPSPAPGPVDSL